MSTQHTPGPWCVSKAKHIGGEHVIATLAADRGDRSLVVHAPHGSSDQDDGNASLISALPELLAVAKSIAAIGFHENMPRTHKPCACTQCEMVRIARVAVAKATGSAT